MRAWLIAAVAVVVSTSSVRADTPHSPRIGALAAAPSTANAFWTQLAKEGTPIVEDVGDPHGRLLVTFVARARAGVTHVAAYGVPSRDNGNYARLAHIKGTDAFAWSVLLEPSARFTYRLAPGDDFGPPSNQPDPYAAERHKLWRLDPLNPHVQSSMAGTPSSLVELPAAPKDPWRTIRRDVPTGTLVAHALTSNALSAPRTIHVYTPPGFSTSDAPYPLVVMTDAQIVVPMFDLTIQLDNLIADKRIPPCVVAMLETPETPDRGRQLPHDEAFADFVALDVVPWLRRTYRATSDPKLTVVAGLSLGGIAAAFAAYRHPEVYGNVISQSGSYWWSNGDSFVDAEQHAHEYASRARLPVRFWIEVGHYEGMGAVTTMLSANRHFHETLVARGYDVSYREFAGGHDVLHWRTSIADALIATLGAPPHATDPLPAVVGSPVGLEAAPAQGDVLVRAYRMAVLDGGAATIAWLEQQGATKVDSLVELEYRLYYGGHVDVAMPIAEWTAAHFRKAWDAFDTLGEGYARLGDKPHAIAAYERALALASKSDGDNARVMLEYLRYKP